MALKPHDSLSQRQKPAITPKQVQSLHILRLPLNDLLVELQRAADENPFLEMVYPSTPGLGSVATSRIEHRQTLGEKLRAQLALMPLDDTVRRLASWLAGDLDDRGFLQSSVQEISDEFSLKPPIVDQAIAALQTCEPAGIAARSLSESLYLQLLRRGHDQALARAVCDHLDLLASGHIAKVARTTGLPPETLARAMDTVRTLNPRPGADTSDQATAIIPEIQVTLHPPDKLRVTLLDRDLPRLSLTTELSALESDKTPRLQALRRDAKTVLTQYSQRGTTVLRVATALTQLQENFFLNGKSGLRPLTRAALASELNMHPTTIGRAVHGKALLFNGRAILLSDLFSTPLATQSGQSVSAFDVQIYIRQLIANEIPGKALRDQDIADLLQSEGVDIARRTVAKYRGCMNIPTSQDRNRHNANALYTSGARHP